jgi:hypothetical protein
MTRFGVPVPPVVGWLAACTIGKNESSSNIATVIDRILFEFAMVFRFFVVKIEVTLFFLLAFFFPKFHKASSMKLPLKSLINSFSL